MKLKSRSIALTFIQSLLFTITQAQVPYEIVGYSFPIPSDCDEEEAVSIYDNGHTYAFGWIGWLALEDTYERNDLKDSNGHFVLVVTDGDGNDVPILLDENGNPVLDGNGDVMDENGDPILDENEDHIAVGDARTVCEIIALSGVHPEVVFSYSFDDYVYVSVDEVDESNGLGAGDYSIMFTSTLGWVKAIANSFSGIVETWDPNYDAGKSWLYSYERAQWIYLGRDSGKFLYVEGSSSYYWVWLQTDSKWIKVAHRVPGVSQEKSDYTENELTIEFSDDFKYVLEFYAEDYVENPTSQLAWIERRFIKFFGDLDTTGYEPPPFVISDGQHDVYYFGAGHTTAWNIAYSFLDANLPTQDDFYYEDYYDSNINDSGFPRGPSDTLGVEGLHQKRVENIIYNDGEMYANALGVVDALVPQISMPSVDRSFVDRSVVVERGGYNPEYYKIENLYYWNMYGYRSTYLDKSNFYHNGDWNPYPEDIRLWQTGTTTPIVNSPVEGPIFTHLPTRLVANYTGFHAQIEPVLADDIDDKDLYGNPIVEDTQPWARSYYSALSGLLTEIDSVNMVMAASYGENSNHYASKDNLSEDYKTFGTVIPYNPPPNEPYEDDGFFLESNMTGAQFDWVHHTSFLSVSHLEWQSPDYGMDEFTSIGPIVWPKNGYLKNLDEDPMGEIRRRWNGGVGGGPIVENDGYIYLLYGEKGVGLCIARVAKDDALDQDAYKVFTGFDGNGDAQWARSLPVGFTNATIRDYYDVPAANASKPILPNEGESLYDESSVDIWSTYVAKIKNTDYHIMAEFTKFQSGKFVIGFRVSADPELVRWSDAFYVSAHRYQWTMQYPRFYNKEGNSNLEIDLDDFYLVGTYAGGLDVMHFKDAFKLNEN